jgi:hypothetical protein
LPQGPGALYLERDNGWAPSFSFIVCFHLSFAMGGQRLREVDDFPADVRAAEPGQQAEILPDHAAVPAESIRVLTAVEQ